jgi:tellurite resistance protein TerC
MLESLIPYIPFIIIITTLLILDLGVFQRKSHSPSLKESSILTIMYIVISLAFNVYVYYTRGIDSATLFLTGYIVEKALSVDNLFVFLTIFTYFNLDVKYQHKVLFLGILGALITRGIFIFAGIEFINRFHFLLYGLGLLLIYTAYKIVFKDGGEPDPSKNFVLTKLAKYLPVKKDYVGNKFLLWENGTLTVTWNNNILSKLNFKMCYVTPLFIVLLVIETTDVMFATDSVPAVLSITQDPFIVYTSNIFAILGLRALYFVIAAMMPKFDYLKYGIAIILAFIGAKMLITIIDIEIPIIMSLSIVAGCLFISILASIIKNRYNPKEM